MEYRSDLTGLGGQHERESVVRGSDRRIIVGESGRDLDDEHIVASVVAVLDVAIAVVLGKDDVRYVGVFTPAQKGLFRLWSPYWNHTHPSVVRAKTGPGGLVPCLLLKVTFTNNSIADIKMEIVEVSGEPQGDPIDASKVRLKIEDGRIFLIKVED